MHFPNAVSTYEKTNQDHDFTIKELNQDITKESNLKFIIMRIQQYNYYDYREVTRVKPNYRYQNWADEHVKKS